MCWIQIPGIHSTSLAEGQWSGDKLGAESRHVQFRAVTLIPQEEKNVQGAEYDQPKCTQGGPHCRQATSEIHVSIQPNNRRYVDFGCF